MCGHVGHRFAGEGVGGVGGLGGFAWLVEWEVTFKFVGIQLCMPGGKLWGDTLGHSAAIPPSPPPHTPVLSRCGKHAPGGMP